jgi:beta-lactamase regulating signal transducer with metallopeptidase domain
VALAYGLTLPQPSTRPGVIQSDVPLPLGDWRLPPSQAFEPDPETSAEPAAESHTLPSLSLAPLAPLTAWLGAAYAGVATFLLGRWLLAYVALGRLLRTAEPAPPALVRRLAALAPGRRLPRLLVSNRLRVPLSCGLLRPTVVVPAGLCQPHATRMLRWVLAHELTHLERRDTWACLLFGLGQAVYFYLPWFWWLRRQVRLCQEYIADAAAAEQTRDATDYAQFLLNLTTAPVVPAGATGVTGSSSDLFRRVSMLLQSPFRLERTCPRWWSILATGGLLAAAVVVSGISLQAEAALIPMDRDLVAPVPGAQPLARPAAQSDRFAVVVDDPTPGRDGKME